MINVVSKSSQRSISGRRRLKVCRAAHTVKSADYKHTATLLFGLANTQYLTGKTLASLVDCRDLEGAYLSCRNGAAELSLAFDERAVVKISLPHAAIDDVLLRLS